MTLQQLKYVSMVEKCGSFSRAVSLAYVQGFRNTPLMVQLLALYALMPAQWGISAEGVAVIALGLFEGAYMADCVACPLNW